MQDTLFAAHNWFNPGRSITTQLKIVDCDVKNWNKQTKQDAFTDDMFNTVDPDVYFLG